MRKFLWSLVVLCVLAAPSLAGEAVGQFTALTGKVSLVAGDKTTPAAAMTKVREGDVVRLDAGATASLAYFANDREETWAGPGCFVVGREGGQGRDGLAPAAVNAETTSGAAPSGVSTEGLAKGGQFMIRGAKKKPAQE